MSDVKTSQTSAGEPALPDFLAELQGDPWIEIRWKRGLARKMHDLSRSDGGGDDVRSRGGRFAYQLSNRQRIGNAIRAPQSMVKVVRKGGASSKGDLVSQLSYLAREGELVLDEYGPDGDFLVEGKEDIKGLAHSWAESWEAAARYDGRSARATSQTYHVVVSFPVGTNADAAKSASDAFADRFLLSEEFGDTWRHVRAWHTDTDHPHMHLVIDRRGASGRMMQINPAKEISPQRLRSLQVETAGDYGILLNDTPRVSRGLTAPALSSAEHRLEERGERQGCSEQRQAYADLTAGFAREILPHEADALRGLGQRVETQAAHLKRDHAHQPIIQSFAVALGAASQSLVNQEELAILQTDTRTEDPITVEALQSMNPDELATTMRRAVSDAQSLAPQITDETKRAALEAETGRIRQLFAQQVPEFRPAIDQRDRADGLEPIVQSRGSAEETRERVASETAERLQRDGNDVERSDYEDRPAIPRDPQATLDQADQRIVDAYALRGMNGTRAIARIKAGMEATAETRNHWHEQELAERMAAGDVPRNAAEKEIAELHSYAAKTYRASERAIQRGVSLVATETFAPEDPAITRRREERFAQERGLEVPDRQQRDLSASFAELDTYLAASEGVERHGQRKARDRDEFHAAGDAGGKEIVALDALAEAAADNPRLYEAAMALDRPLVRDALVISKYGDEGKEAVRLHERITDNIASGETDTSQHHQLMRDAKESVSRSPALREFDGIPDLVNAYRENHREEALEQSANNMGRRDSGAKDHAFDHARQSRDDTQGKRLTEEELRQQLVARERELLAAQKAHAQEHGVDQSRGRDNGLGLAD